MIKLILIINGSDTGINVELKSDAEKPTPQEKLFAQQMGRTISDFLNNAERGEKPE